MQQPPNGYPPYQGQDPTTGSYPPNYPYPGGQAPPPGYPPYPQTGAQYPQNGQPYPPNGQMYPQQQPPVKKKKKKTWLIVTGVIVGALVLCGVFASHAGTSNTGTTAANNTGTSNTTNSAPSPTQHFKPGDTVKIGGIWQVVASNVRTDPGGQYDALKSGDTYLAIDASFTNISNSEQQLFGSADWTLKDASGQTYNSSIDSNITATEPQGKIEAGGPGKGTLVYEIPSATKQFTLAFETNAFESGQTIWDISVC